VDDDPLLAARADALVRVAALTATHAEIVAASEGSNADDEHDPEGATIAFERQQVSALLEQALASVAAADAALARRSSGRYGECERCGRGIAAERLQARPTATSCIGCAQAVAGRR
jgi:DnaK suppressor protein